MVTVSSMLGHASPSTTATIYSHEIAAAKAKAEAEMLKDSFISIEHILLAMTQLDNSNIKSFLARFKVQKDTILKVKEEAK